MDSLCAIISGGEYTRLDKINEAEYIIACDRGFEYAKRENLQPDLILGDFDSYSGALPDNTEILKLPVEKDDTDTMSAARQALNRGYKNIRIYCALGGRLDHLTANVQTGAFIAQNGARCELIGRDAVIYIFSGGSIKLEERLGWSLSLFALSNEVHGVCISGAKYTLEDATVTNTFPIGTSNEWRGDVEISAKDGILAVMSCRMPGE